MTNALPLLSLDELINILSFMTKDAAYIGSNPERHGQRCVQFVLHDVSTLAPGRELEQIVTSLAHYSYKTQWDADIIFEAAGPTLRIFNPPCDIMASLRAANTRTTIYPKPVFSDAPTHILSAIPAPVTEGAETRVLSPMQDDGTTRVLPAVREESATVIVPAVTAKPPVARDGTRHISAAHVDRLKAAGLHGTHPTEDAPTQIVGSQDMRERLAEAPEQPAPKQGWLQRMSAALKGGPKDKGRR